MKDDTTFFESLAKNLIDLNKGGQLPKRYLALRQRRRAIQKLVDECRKEGREENMLAELKFRAPLSMAGETSSLAMVCTEGLELANVPVAKELDERGHHRGTPLADIKELLEAETGREWGIVEIVTEYRRLMSWHPLVIGSHEEPRYAKIPRLLEMINQERESLEVRLSEFIRAEDLRIFSVAAETGSLAKAVGLCAGPEVTVGFSGGSRLILNGKFEVLVGWGHGCGVRSILLSDLRSLLGRPGDLIVIDCDIDGWEAWTDSAVVVVQSTMDFELPESKRFEYYFAT